MKIVADEQIAFTKEALETLGQVRCLAGRSIGPNDLNDASVLLVRSVTKVDGSLLQGSRIQFVGSATAGIDHIDTEYLQRHGIGFASAAGSNANSVAEYVATAILLWAKRKGISVRGKSIGIIGVGNIGSLVKKKTEALGMRVLLNDPPLEQITGEDCYSSLSEALDCEVVTVHVALTLEGQFKTFHLLNQHNLPRLRSDSLFINTSRGEAVETRGLLKQLARGNAGHTVLDVWEEEPRINWDLFQQVNLGTPHIAGYSLDGKIQGTLMIYKALCKHMNLEPTWNPALTLPPSDLPFIEVQAQSKLTEVILCDLATSVYDPQVDHSRMTQLLRIPIEQRAVEFDRLRKEYPVRREFHGTRVGLPEGTESLKQQIRALGLVV